MYILLRVSWALVEVMIYLDNNSFGSYTNRASTHNWIIVIVSCFDPVFEPGLFTYHLLTMNTLQIICNKWGYIGKVVLEEIQPSKYKLILESPQTIYSDELPKYEKLIHDECIGPKGRLAEILGQEDIVNLNLAEALYEKRVQRQQEFKIWLFNRLQIFGYRDLDSEAISNGADKIDEHFDFPIKGTPAQFGVMLRQYAQTLHDQQQLASQILFPGSRKVAGSIPPDANPVEAKLSLEKSRLSIHAEMLPSNGTLLRVHLNGEKNLWRLWDQIRDELEKLGWFCLPDLPTPHTSGVTEVEVTRSQITNPASETWMSIPDIGANREILRLWHQGLTCEQIAVRVGLTGKTVLNRINKLRNEFGIQIVPYRKSNFIKKAKDRSS